MEWVTTTTLLRDLQTFGNEQAWERFFGHFRRPLTAFGRRIGLSGSEADDAAQETLLAFAQRYQQGDYERSKGRLRQWLFGIAYRQALGQRSRRTRQDRQVQDADGGDFWQELPDEATATLHFDQEWEAAVLQHCLGRVKAEVTPQTYAAFELLVREGVPVEEVMQRLEMNRNAVYNAKHRVLKRARELARDYEGPLEGGGS